MWTRDRTMFDAFKDSMEEALTIFALSAKVRAAAWMLLLPCLILILGLLVPEARTDSVYDVLANSVFDGTRRLVVPLAVVTWIRLGYYVAKTYQQERTRLYGL